MSLFGRNWIDEDPPEDRYKKITGRDVEPDELRKCLEDTIENDNYLSKSERRELIDIQQTIKNG